MTTWEKMVEFHVWAQSHGWGMFVTGFFGGIWGMWSSRHQERKRSEKERRRLQGNALPDPLEWGKDDVACYVEKVLVDGIERKWCYRASPKEGCASCMAEDHRGQPHLANDLSDFVRICHTGKVTYVMRKDAPDWLRAA